jgi:hypothetical protein
VRLSFKAVILCGATLLMSGSCMAMPEFHDQDKLAFGESGAAAAYAKMAWDHPDEWYHRHHCILRERRVWNRHLHGWTVDNVWECRHRHWG